MGRRSRTEISPLGESTSPNSAAGRRVAIDHHPDHLRTVGSVRSGQSFTRPSAGLAESLPSRRAIRLAERALEAPQTAPETAAQTADSEERERTHGVQQPTAIASTFSPVSRRTARALERAARPPAAEPAAAQPAGAEPAVAEPAVAQAAAEPLDAAASPIDTEHAQPAASSSALAPAMPAPDELSNLLPDLAREQPAVTTPSAGIPIFVVPPAPGLAVPPVAAPTFLGAASTGRGATRRRAGAHPRHGGGASRSRRRVAATASAASIGLISSLLFAMPANAVPSTLPAGVSPVAVDATGRTAAQILAVSSTVTVDPTQRDSTVAAALAGIIASQDGADSGTAAAAIAAALQSGGARQSIVETALSYLGDPYVLGGSDHSGIDCSGLVLVAYATIGIPLKHLVSAQDAAGVVIPQSEAQPGDLVVFDDNEHIGIYLGANLLIAAPEEGRPVNVEPVWAGIPHHFTRILSN